MLQAAEDVADPDSGKTEKHMQENIGRGFDDGPVFEKSQ